MSETPQRSWAPLARSFSPETLKRYSRVVTSFKIILPVFAVAMLAVLMIVPSVNSPPDPAKKNVNPDSAMQNPVYNSVDEENRPYKVEATQAFQHPDAPGITDLAQPKAALDLGNGQSLNAEAAKGKYDQASGMLHLNGGLTLQHSDGTTFSTEKADIDVNTHDAAGDAPVVLQGGFGEVRGERFKTLEGGKTIIFEGQSRATLNLGGGGLQLPSKNVAVPVSPAANPAPSSPAPAKP
jgi:LPS export ABC transporter protein LptC